MDTPTRHQPEIVNVDGDSGASPVSPLPPWDMYVVSVSLISGYILIPLLVSQALMLIDPFMGETAQLIVQQGTTLVTWVSIFALLRWRYGPIAPYLGLVLNRSAAYYLWETILLILMTTALTLGLNFFWILLSHYLPAWHPEDKVPYADFHSMRLLVLAGFAVFMAPFLEELIFRGLVQSAFHKACKPVASVLWTTLVFLLLHGSYFGDVKALAHVLVLGVCIGFWRERTQSLVPGMVAHWFNNGLALMMLLLHAGSS